MTTASCPTPSTTKAQEIVARYPVPRSALIMLLHEAQDEVGYVNDDVDQRGRRGARA